MYKRPITKTKPPTTLTFAEIHQMFFEAITNVSADYGVEFTGKLVMRDALTEQQMELIFESKADKK